MASVIYNFLMPLNLRYIPVEGTHAN